MTNAGMALVPINDSLHPLVDNVEQTYVTSFPENERRDFALIKELIAKNEAFTLYVLLSNGEYVGFITEWEFEDFRYIEHFAIDESARNGGNGARSLELFIKNNDKPIVLEVELPSDEMSKRRVGFYERLGFALDDHFYFQPPYRASDSTLEMRLMALGDIDLLQSFDKVRATLHKYVYGVL